MCYRVNLFDPGLPFRRIVWDFRHRYAYVVTALEGAGGGRPRETGVAAAEEYNEEGSSSLEYRLEREAIGEMTRASGLAPALIREALARR